MADSSSSTTGAVPGGGSQERASSPGGDYHYRAGVSCTTTKTISEDIHMEQRMQSDILQSPKSHVTGSAKGISFGTPTIFTASLTKPEQSSSKSQSTQPDHHRAYKSESGDKKTTHKSEKEMAHWGRSPQRNSFEVRGAQAQGNHIRGGSGHHASSNKRKVKPRTVQSWYPFQTREKPNQRTIGRTSASKIIRDGPRTPVVLLEKLPENYKELIPLLINKKYVPRRLLGRKHYAKKSDSRGSRSSRGQKPSPSARPSKPKCSTVPVASPLGFEKSFMAYLSLSTKHTMASSLSEADKQHTLTYRPARIPRVSSTDRKGHLPKDARADHEESRSNTGGILKPPTGSPSAHINDISLIDERARSMSSILGTNLKPLIGKTPSSNLKKYGPGKPKSDQVRKCPNLKIKLPVRDNFVHRDRRVATHNSVGHQPKTAPAVIREAPQYGKGQHKATFKVTPSTSGPLFLKFKTDKPLEKTPCNGTVLKSAAISPRSAWVERQESAVSSVMKFDNVEPILSSVRSEISTGSCLNFTAGPQEDHSTTPCRQPPKVAARSPSAHEVTVPILSKIKLPIQAPHNESDVGNTTRCLQAGTFQHSLFHAGAEITWSEVFPLFIQKQSQKLPFLSVPPKTLCVSCGKFETADSRRDSNKSVCNSCATRDSKDEQISVGQSVITPLTSVPYVCDVAKVKEHQVAVAMETQPNIASTEPLNNGVTSDSERAQKSDLPKSRLKENESTRETTNYTSSLSVDVECSNIPEPCEEHSGVRSGTTPESQIQTVPVSSPVNLVLREVMNSGLQDTPDDRTPVENQKDSKNVAMESSSRCKSPFIECTVLHLKANSKDPVPPHVLGLEAEQLSGSPMMLNINPDPGVSASDKDNERTCAMLTNTDQENDIFTKDSVDTIPELDLSADTTCVLPELGLAGGTLSTLPGLDMLSSRLPPVCDTLSPPLPPPEETPTSGFTFREDTCVQLGKDHKISERQFDKCSVEPEPEGVPTPKTLEWKYNGDETTAEPQGIDYSVIFDSQCRESVNRTGSSKSHCTETPGDQNEEGVDKSRLPDTMDTLAVTGQNTECKVTSSLTVIDPKAAVDNHSSAAANAAGRTAPSCTHKSESQEGENKREPSEKGIGKLSDPHNEGRREKASSSDQEQGGTPDCKDNSNIVGVGNDRMAEPDNKSKEYKNNVQTSNDICKSHKPRDQPEETSTSQSGGQTPDTGKESHGASEQGANAPAQIRSKESVSGCESNTNPQGFQKKSNQELVQDRLQEPLAVLHINEADMSISEIDAGIVAETKLAVLGIMMQLDILVAKRTDVAAPSLLQEEDNVGPLSRSKQTPRVLAQGEDGDASKAVNCIKKQLVVSGDLPTQSGIHQDDQGQSVSKYPTHQNKDNRKISIAGTNDPESTCADGEETSLVVQNTDEKQNTSTGSRVVVSVFDDEDEPCLCMSSGPGESLRLSPVPKSEEATSEEASRSPLTHKPSEAGSPNTSLVSVDNSLSSICSGKIEGHPLGSGRRENETVEHTGDGNEPQESKTFTSQIPNSLSCQENDRSTPTQLLTNDQSNIHDLKNLSETEETSSQNKEFLPPVTTTMIDDNSNEEEGDTYKDTQSEHTLNFVIEDVVSLTDIDFTNMGTEQETNKEGRLPFIDEDDDVTDDEGERLVIDETGMHDMDENKSIKAIDDYDACVIAEHMVQSSNGSEHLGGQERDRERIGLVSMTTESPAGGLSGNIEGMQTPSDKTVGRPAMPCDRTTPPPTGHSDTLLTLYATNGKTVLDVTEGQRHEHSTDGDIRIDTGPADYKEGTLEHGALVRYVDIDLEQHQEDGESIQSSRKVRGSDYPDWNLGRIVSVAERVPHKLSSADVSPEYDTYDRQTDCCPRRQSDNEGIICIGPHYESKTGDETHRASVAMENVNLIPITAKLNSHFEHEVFPKQSVQLIRLKHTERTDVAYQCTPDISISETTEQTSRSQSAKGKSRRGKRRQNRPLLSQKLKKKAQTTIKEIMVKPGKLEPMSSRFSPSGDDGYETCQRRSRIPGRGRGRGRGRGIGRGRGRGRRHSMENKFILTRSQSKARESRHGANDAPVREPWGEGSARPVLPCTIPLDVSPSSIVKRRPGRPPKRPGKTDSLGGRRKVKNKICVPFTDEKLDIQLTSLRDSYISKPKDSRKKKNRNMSSAASSVRPQVLEKVDSKHKTEGMEYFNIIT